MTGTVMAIEADAVDPAGNHGKLYGLLAAIYRHEVTAGLLRELRRPELADALAATGVTLEGALLEGPEEEVLEALAVAYTALFIGPGRHVPPYASVHMPAGNGELWGEATVWVRHFIESAGYDYAAGFNDLPDHLAVELELMGNLWAREAEADANADRAAASDARDLRAAFVRDHLGRWLPVFCDKAASRATHPFYAEIARLTKAVVQWEIRSAEHSACSAIAPRRSAG
jgi:TorA maturation chaperone TorD